MTDWRRTASIHVLVAVAYLIAAWIGLEWSVPEAFAGFVWPAAGAGLAAVLLCGHQVLPTLFLCSLVVRAASGAPAIHALVATLGEILAMAMAAWLLRRAGGLHLALDRTRDVIAFVLLGAGASTLISAGAGTLGLVLSGIASAPDALGLWWRWWLAHAVGVLIATPPALAWSAPPPELRLSRRRIEGAVTMGLLVIAGGLAFGGLLERPASLVFVFASYPLMLFVALRQSIRWTSLALVVLAAMTVGGTALERGAFDTGSIQLSLVVVWGYLLTTGTMALLLGAAVAEAHTASATTERLAAIVEATSDLVGIADPRGRVLSLNAAGRRMVGLAPEAPLDVVRLADYVPRWALELAQSRSIPHATRTGLWEGETALLHRDGHEIPVSQVIVAHRDERGQLAYLSTIVRDLSERRRLEAQLIESQKMESVGRLAGGVAHDFNNLLTAIMGYIDLAAASLDDPDRAQSYLTPIRTSAERAGRLVRQLLAFARKQVLAPKTVDLNELTAETLPLLQPMLVGSVELDVRSTPGLPPVSIDPVQFEQVVLNLAVNARDAMPNGGRLVLATDHVVTTGEPDAAHPGIPAGRWVRLTVSDEGTGMSEEVQRRAFEPFFTTKPIGQGTGLGLSMVHGIVTQHGGWIWCESRPDAGTSFRIYLPEARGGARES
jgi:PAS domain S-box-containing protein